MAEQPTFAEGHEHTEDCWALYREWKRYHAVIQDTRSALPRQVLLEAMRERDKSEHQLRLLGCSGDAIRREERDREIAEHGHPLL